MTTILAIDPGVTGALASYLTDFPDRVSVLDMPLVDGEVNPHELRDIINTYKPTCAIIEQVGPMPRDAARQAWRFSAAFTTARTVVALLNIPNGESANAARMIAAMAEAKKITINELIAMAHQGASGHQQQTKPPPPPQDDFTDIDKADDPLRMLKKIADKPALVARVLTAWEVQFATDVSVRYEHDYELSEKQLVVIEKILRKASRAFP